jgi:NADH-ubiquinone oxidoreductase chain 2
MLSMSILYLLLSNAVNTRRAISILFNRIAIISLIYCILQNILLFFTLGKGVSLHGGLLYISDITETFQLFIFFISILILQLTSFHNNKVLLGFNLNSNYLANIFKKINADSHIIEYPLIILFIISGGLFLMSTNDLVSIFLSIELQSYGLYLLSTIYRNSELSTTGGLIYFLLGGLSSCFILLGTSLLYANSGTTSLDGLYLISSIHEKNFQ